MKDDRYLIDRLNKGWGIQTGIYVGGKKLQAEEETRQPEEVIHYFEKNLKDRPLIYMEEKLVYYWGFLDGSGKMYLMGPVASESLTGEQQNTYRFRHHITDQTFHVPKMQLAKGLSMVCMNYFMITGRMLTEKKIRMPDETDHLRQEHILERERVRYQLFQYEGDRVRQPYEMEKHWMEQIERGETGKLYGMDQTGKKMDTIGVMAENDDYKQTEYTVVTAVTLAARAAIEGGLTPSESLEMSDLYLQKAAKCHNSLELLNVMEEAVNSFTEAVRVHKTQIRYGEYIEQTKDYIAKHLYKKFKISQIAEELGVNSSYLSRRFSEQTGKTISQYILKERLKAAANLLKYSEESIGQIAEYMQFSSPSRFGEYFKNAYGETPAKYREEKKLIDFVSSDSRGRNE